MLKYSGDDIISYIIMKMYYLNYLHGITTNKNYICYNYVLPASCNEYSKDNLHNTSS